MEVVRVETAAQMREAVLERLPEVDIVIKAAAVADFTPAVKQTEKIKRKGPMTVELEPTTDILAEASKRSRPGQVMIALPRRRKDALENARGKLKKQVTRCDRGQ